MSNETVTIYTGAKANLPADIPPAESEVVWHIGGNEYPWATSPNCKTCTSPYRQEIEKKLMATFSYVAVAQSLPEELGITANNLSVHAKRHMGINKTIKQVIIDETAKDAGLNPAEYAGALGNYITLAKLGVQSVLEQMAEGVIQPDLDQAISLSNLLIKAQAAAGDKADQDAQIHALMLLREAILKVCTPEQAELISEYVSSGGKLSLTDIEEGEWVEGN